MRGRGRAPIQPVHRPQRSGEERPKLTFCLVDSRFQRLKAANLVAKNARGRIPACKQGWVSLAEVGKHPFHQKLALAFGAIGYESLKLHSIFTCNTCSTGLSK